MTNIGERKRVMFTTYDQELFSIDIHDELIITNAVYQFFKNTCEIDRDNTRRHFKFVLTRLFNLHIND